MKISSDLDSPLSLGLLLYSDLSHDLSASLGLGLFLYLQLFMALAFSISSFSSNYFAKISQSTSLLGSFLMSGSALVEAMLATAGRNYRIGDVFKDSESTLFLFMLVLLHSSVSKMIDTASVSKNRGG